MAEARNGGALRGGARLFGSLEYTRVARNGGCIELLTAAPTDGHVLITSTISGAPADTDLLHALGLPLSAGALALLVGTDRHLNFLTRNGVVDPVPSLIVSLEAAGQEYRSTLLAPILPHSTKSPLWLWSFTRCGNDLSGDAAADLLESLSWECNARALRALHRAMKEAEHLGPSLQT